MKALLTVGKMYYFAVNKYKQPQNVHKRWLKEARALGVSREENGYSL